jgi:hypothetical protein
MLIKKKISNPKYIKSSLCSKYMIICGEMMALKCKVEIDQTYKWKRHIYIYIYQ